MSDESKAEAFGVCVILVTFIAILLTAPTWMPLLDAMLEPKPIVVVECSR